MLLLSLLKILITTYIDLISINLRCYKKIVLTIHYIRVQIVMIAGEHFVLTNPFLCYFVDEINNILIFFHIKFVLVLNFVSL